jgi:hypothetical protein
MGELQSVKTVKLSVRPLFRPNTGPRAGRGAARRGARGQPSVRPRPRLRGSAHFRVFSIFAYHLLAGMVATVVSGPVPSREL